MIISVVLFFNVDYFIINNNFKLVLYYYFTLVYINVIKTRLLIISQNIAYIARRRLNL